MRRLAGIISCWIGLVKTGAAASIAVLGSRPPTSVMETNEENLAHVAELIEKAKAAGLRGAGWLESLGVKRCCEGYNGIGPEFLPAWARALVTKHLGLFEPAALPHDMRNDVSDGSREKFLAANDEFRANCHILAERAYPNDPKRRIAAQAAAEVLFLFVNADGFGWKAWLEAHERFVNKQKGSNK